jgi:hypothetical protein
MWTTRAFGNKRRSVSRMAWSVTAPPNVICRSGRPLRRLRLPSERSQCQYDGVAETCVTTVARMSRTTASADASSEGARGLRHSPGKAPRPASPRRGVGGWPGASDFPQTFHHTRPAAQGSPWCAARAWACPCARTLKGCSNRDPHKARLRAKAAPRTLHHRARLLPADHARRQGWPGCSRRPVRR